MYYKESLSGSMYIAAGLEAAATGLFLAVYGENLDDGPP
jgi:hypothetical protein